MKVKPNIYTAILRVLTMGIYYKKKFGSMFVLNMKQQYDFLYFPCKDRNFHFIFGMFILLESFFLTGKLNKNLHISLNHISIKTVHILYSKQEILTIQEFKRLSLCCLYFRPPVSLILNDKPTTVTGSTPQISDTHTAP